MENSVQLVLDKHFPDAGPIKAPGSCNRATIQKAIGQNPTKLEESVLGSSGSVLGGFFCYCFFGVLLYFQ